MRGPRLLKRSVRQAIADLQTATKVAAAAPVNGVAATGVLTLDTQPTAGDTITIGNVVYTFVAAGTADAAGEVNLGANLAATKPLLVAAINGSGLNTANPKVSAAAFNVNAMTVTARLKGTAGNALATTETLTAGTNVWAAAHLTGGIDCTVAPAETFLYYGGYLHFTPTATTVASATWVRSAQYTTY